MSENKKSEDIKRDEENFVHSILRESRARELDEAERELADVNQNDIKLTPLQKDMIRDESADAQEAEEIIADKEAKLRERKLVAIASKRINQATPSRMLLERPAWGATDANAEVHMRQTWAVTLGRDVAPKITGLFGFASNVKRVISSYRKGCPFAAMVLLQLEEELKHVNEIFKIKEHEVRKLLDTSIRIKMKPFVSEMPVSLELSFASPYSYHVTELLLIYDDILRLTYPYYQARIIETEYYFNLTRTLGRHLRRIMQCCNGYSFVGAESTLKKDSVYQAAVNVFGELNPGIIDKTLLPYLVRVPPAFMS